VITALKRQFLNQSPEAWLPLIIPFIVYIVHASLFFSWIVDDAGITYAYARNLAHGYGLVSQPGAAPVEGFSNFTWTISLAALFAVGIFDPVSTTKFVSLLLVGTSYFIVYRGLRYNYAGRLVTLVALTLTSLNTSFVIWTSSGLEGPLYVLLVVLLLFQAHQLLASEKLPPSALLRVGVIAAALAMTRPDGVMYVLTIPAILVMRMLRGEHVSFRLLVSWTLQYGSAFAVVFGSFLVFRLIYYHDILPNTYYAKLLDPRPDSLIAWFWKIQEPVFSTVEYVSRPVTDSTALLVNVSIAMFITGTGLLFTWLLLARKRLTTLDFCVLLFLLTSWAVYVMLPKDWMGEYRFATPFFILYYPYVVSLIVRILDAVDLPRRSSQYLSIGLYASLILMSTLIFSQRSVRFADAPTVPFADVTEISNQFDWYAEVLSLNTASLLAPDLGGTLYYSSLQVYDLAGLTDRTVARTMGKDQAAFYKYVFENIRPTFIEIHDFWTFTADFDRDRRFRQEYTPICEYPDDRYPLFSGHFVRQDVVKNQPEAFQYLQSQVDAGNKCKLVRDFAALQE
jgi:hypothetical protein